MAIENENLEDFRGILNIITSKMVLPLYFSFWILDVIYVPQLKWEFLALRSVIVPSALFINFFTKTANNTPYLQNIALIYVFILAGILNIMIYIVGPNALYYNCLHLVAIGSLSFIPFSRFYFVLASIAIYGPYYIIELSRITTTSDYIELAVNSFIVMSVLMITFIIKLYHQHFREKDKKLRFALEQEIVKTKQAEKELIVAKDIAEDSTKAKGIFLANMSHEIRTPLTSIIGFSKILASKKLLESTREKYTNTVIRNSEHLLRLVNDVLDFSKIEANKLVIDKSKISLFGFVEDISSLMEENIKQKGLACKINYIYPLPEFILTDEVRLKQIVINLCGNALKFTSKGSIDFTIEYTNDNNQLRFTVSDSGIGLSEEEIRNIFDSFSQADDTTSKKYGGTGLGLAISKQLTQKLGGELTVESIVGKGSHFNFYIDPGKSESLNLVNKIPKMNSGNINYQSIFDALSVEGHVLLVEDTIDNQVLISSYLEDMGAKITIANNGSEAVEFMLHNTYDLVLMDMQMPVMSGVEALINVRNNNYTKPIVMLTGNSAYDEKKECELAGCDDFIVKPINLTVFADTIVKYLNTNKKEIDDIEFTNKPVTELPHINLEGKNDPIYSTLIGKSPKYDTIIENFSERLNEIIQKIDHVYQINDIDALNTETHRLKGVGGNMGYLTLTETCINIENCIKNDDSDLLANNIKTLKLIEERIAIGLQIYNSKKS